MAFRIRDVFRILRQGGPGHLARFASGRLVSYRSFRQWVRSLPPETPLEPLDGERLDFLFIDGDHSAAGTRNSQVSGSKEMNLWIGIEKTSW